ncbi:PAS domain S-box protein [Lichenicola cladoniae]|uniref:histidine kinase n=1 Tax=Lichenicola cladoniae TaxID=1484109 RepID=A0A6M8HRV7_9PROT|nr:PAS domain S-box protein [Lichenicola cladoniae]NPD65941.1 PAS domain S-box protein [Acetobacteraceae bacterium]QKE91068.1 PAS domain S-box protein [Lichenicola cladoniae]
MAPDQDLAASGSPTHSGHDDAGDRQHRAIFESAVDFAIIATGLDGRVTDWNIGAEHVFGWSRQEMHGEPIDRIFTPEDRAARHPEQEMRQSLELGRSIGERWHVRRDGTRFWGNGEMMPLRDASGTHLGFLEILRDRTEHWASEERHRASAEFLTRVLAASADCIKVLDLDARLVFMSEGGQQVMEVEDLDAIIGCPWPNFWRDEGNVAALAAIEAARAGGTGHFQGSAETMAGNPRWWDVRVTPILSADGVPEKLLVVSSDITERRKADADIGNLAGLVEQSSDFIGIASPETRVLFVNPAGRRLVGLGGGTLELGVIDFFTEDDRRTVIDTVLPALHRRGYWEGELRFRHFATGAAIPVLYTVFALRNAAGTMTGYGTITRDLRERHRADARRNALLELGDRMRDLADPVEMAFVAAEIMGQTLEVSRTGYGTLDACGESVLVDRDWTAPGCGSVAGAHRMADYGAYYKDLQRGDTVAIADVAKDPRTSANLGALQRVGIKALLNLPLIERGRLVALFYINHSEPRAWTEDELSFVRNVAERTRGAIERRLAEKRLRDLAALLEQQVAERTRERDRIWRVSQDLLGVADMKGCWISINPAWHALLGWNEDEIVGRTLEWLEHPDDRATTRAAFAGLADGKPTHAYENRVRHRDGHDRWLAWTAVPEADLIYCVGRDVTAEKAAAEALRQAEDHLRQSQKMEAVGQLTGGLAHDFNNLLTGITGSLEMLGNRVAQGRVGEVDRFISAAQGAARRAAALTHRLLAFSRRQTLDPKATGVNRLVSGMEELIRRTVGPSIDIEVVGATGLWTALVDPNQLENALLNLCINARDAMPDGGRILIETGNTWMDQQAAGPRDLAPGAYLSLSVTDTGSGMTPEVIARAFDPFFTTKPLGEGTGLGLSMIYGFARQSGGQICIQSTPGAGTTMCLYLPRHLGPEDTVPEIRKPAGTARATEGQTVLVVDDEPIIRMLVRETLGDLGYVAIEASDGAGGMAMLSSKDRVDLLVTDVGLPGGFNGRQLADAGRALRPGLKVLFITGYAENAVIGNGALDHGMQVLTKPFAMDALADRIERLITG